MPVPPATGRFVRTAMVAGLISVPALVGQAAYAAPRPTPSYAGFERLATVPVYLNSAEDQETVAEISAVSTDGKTVISTDSPGERLGFIDITDPAHPKPDGHARACRASRPRWPCYQNYALAVVNTSEDFINTVRRAGGHRPGHPHDRRTTSRSAASPTRSRWRPAASTRRSRSRTSATRTSTTARSRRSRPASSQVVDIKKTSRLGADARRR